MAGLGQSAIEHCEYLLRAADRIFSHIGERISNTQNRKWHLLSGPLKTFHAATQGPVVLKLPFIYGMRETRHPDVIVIGEFFIDEILSGFQTLPKLGEESFARR